MTTNLANAKVWDGTQWVQAVGQPWYTQLPGQPAENVTATVTADAVAHTKGAWTELVASTSDDVTAIGVTVGGIGQSGVNTATLLDFAVGASGSEVAFAQNIAVGSAFRTLPSSSGVSFLLPCSITAGSRVSARIQSVVGGKSGSVTLSTWNLGNPTIVDILGANTATSRGTAMTGSAGSWTEIVASTSVDYQAVGIVPSAHDGSLATLAATYDVGVGSSGNEVAFGTIEAAYTSQEYVWSVGSSTAPLFTRFVPAGSRLAVRHDITTGVPAEYGVVLIGVR